MQVMFVMGLVLVKKQALLVMSVYELDLVTCFFSFSFPPKNHVIFLHIIMYKGISTERYYFVCAHPFPDSKLECLACLIYGS